MPCHQSIIPILFSKMFIILPMSLDIINILESICISPTYNVLNVFDCSTSPIESMLDYFRYTIIWLRGSFQHYYLIETVLLPFTIHPTIRYINITFTIISLIVYPAFMLICFLVCLSNLNVLIMLCGVHFRWGSGLPFKMTSTTKPSYHPGKSWLSEILMNIRSQLISKDVPKTNETSKCSDEVRPADAPVLWLESPTHPRRGSSAHTHNGSKRSHSFEN